MPKTYIGSGLEWPNSKKIRKIVMMSVEVKGTYSDIYMEDIPTDISKTLMEISNVRADLI